MKRILCLLIFISFLACQKDKSPGLSVNYIISPEPIMVVKYGDFKSWQESVYKQSLLSKNKGNSVIEFWNLNDFQDIVEIPKDAILSISSLGNNKLIKTLSYNVEKDIKLKVDSKQAYTYDNISVSPLETPQGEFYHATLGDKAVLSSSKIILENIIRNYKNEIDNPEEITKLLDVLSDKTPSLIINNATFPKIVGQFFDKSIMKYQLDLGYYSGFDINLDEDKILLSGIVFNPEDEDKLWARFNTVQPQQPTTIEVIPGNFVSAGSVLFSDLKQLKNPEESIEQESKADSLYLNIREITSVKLSNGKTTILASNNINQSFDFLKKTSKPHKTLGDNVIYKLNQSIVPGNDFRSIIEVSKAEFYTVYMDYILFSNKLETVENLIIQINNKNVVSNLANYNNHISSLNSECHVQWLTNLNNQEELFDKHVKDAFKSDFKKIKWDKHEILMSQLIVEDDFGYLNILNKKTVENQKNISVNQIARLKNKNNIINKPVFFENWRTGQQDVVYQDDNNVLHLKDTKGNLIWSKALDEPIIGKISSIDIYQNRRIQMAFVTKDKIHIIDKNGKDVSPFPLKLRNNITQGLSVFDYDNNGKYRFTVIQDDDVRMYDKNAKRVRGFKFGKSKSNIINPAKHIRMANKDYILVQESSGKIHILNRRGKTRIDLNENLKLSDNEWFEHENYFTSISKDGNILKINQQGNLTKDDKEFLNPKFSANKKNLVILSENKFYFNSYVTELPYGLYTTPKINNNFAGIADKQAQKIYIFNNEAKVIEGFPVYGEEIYDLHFKEDKLVILCKDGDDAMIVYSVNF